MKTTLTYSTNSGIESQYCANVYIDLSGRVRPTKRDMGTEGLWYFDGQFFSLKHPRYWSRYE